MTQYVPVEESTGRVLYLPPLGFFGKPDPVGYDGPKSWQPFPHDGIVYRPWQGYISFSPPNGTSAMLWSNAGPVWVDLGSVAQLKLRKRAEITADRIAADEDHFMYQGKKIKTGDKDMSDIAVTAGYVALFGRLSPKWPGGWKAVDDTYVRIDTVDEFRTFYEAMYDAGITNFMWSQELKARLEMAATPEEVRLLKW